MSSYAIKSAGQWLGILLVKEGRYLFNVKDKVEELQRQLELMQCFLLDADKKQNKNALVRKWVSEISDMALEAEDVTDKYILTVKHKRKDGYINSFKWLACFWKDANTLHIVGCRIDGLTSRTAKLSSSLRDFGVQNVEDNSQSSLAEARRTYAHAQPDYLVGLKEDVNKLIIQLEEGPQKIVVAHGMGGIGKTALAREIYRSCLSQSQFVGCAWAYVSQQCNLEAVCKELLYGLIPKEDTEQRSMIKSLELSELPGKLCEILQGNKYLVVLDDVWFLSSWNRLHPAFPIHDTSCGSRILITTRNPQIFSNLGQNLVFTWKVETLNQDNSWELLGNMGRFKRATLDSLMKVQAQKMLNHCNGHPLAIVVLGGVLSTKKSLDEWESVCENLQFHLRGDHEDSYSGVYDVLAMSYYDLHYNMKPCFLHLGSYPEDFCIDVEKLYNLWIADGIVSSTQDLVGRTRSLEDVADDYLNQLIQKNMVQVDKKQSNGRIQACRVHDLMRDKCVEMAIEENFLQTMNIDGQQKASVNTRTDQKARRLTVYVGEETSETILESLSGKRPFLRSLTFISTCRHAQKSHNETCDWIKTICKRFKLLRVLDFKGGPVLNGVMPTEIGNLIYLRYLCLYGAYVTELPSSIRNLKSLLILDLRVARRIIKLPNVLWEMRSLCWLYFPQRLLSQEDGYSFPQGYEIKDGSQLILDKLSQLERLTGIDLDEIDVKGLLELTSMKKLSATCRRQKDKLLPFLASSSIKRLNLNIDASLLSGDSEMLLSESTSLRKLHIDANKSPLTYIQIRIEMFPCNLLELGFWYCTFAQDPMTILEKLPKLQRLQLRICYQGRDLHCSENGFPELTYLILDGLSSLQHLNVEKGGFPKLKEMEIYNCPLKEIPDALPPKIQIYGLNYSSVLQALVEQFRTRQGLNST